MNITARSTIFAALLAASAGLAGCSGAPQQPTAAIAPASAVALPADGAAQPGEALPGAMSAAETAKLPANTAFAVPVDRLDCDQMKAELDLFAADETSKKLEQYGKAKYLPTAKEAASFNRLVAVKQANGERCKVTKKAGKKPTMKDKTASATVLKKVVKPVKAAVAPVKATVEKIPAETVSTTEVAE